MFNLACKHVFWFLNFQFCILDICEDLSWDFQKSPTCPLVSTSPLSPRSHFHWIPCPLYVRTVSQSPLQLSHEQLFHPLEPLYKAYPGNWDCYYKFTRASGFYSFLHIMEPKFYSWNPASSRNDPLHVFPFHHKQFIWVISILWLYYPSPPTSYGFTSYCAYRKRLSHWVRKCESGEWPNLLTNDLDIAALGPHLSFSKMTSPHTWTFRWLRYCQSHKCLFNS